MSNKPLVSIGLPTYNRAASLRRAIESVLSQDYRHIELIISDNASTDETKTICLAASARDSRIRYSRQTENLGMTANFGEVLNQAHGEFFMWLADDDWLGSGYLSACVQFLLEHPDYVIACGHGSYFEGDEVVYHEGLMTFDQSNPADRVRAYYNGIELNTIFYGLMRRDLLCRLPLHWYFGSDWNFIASAAVTGKIKTLHEIDLFRNIGGVSQDVERLARQMGLSKLQARNAHLVLAVSAFEDIAWKSPVYTSLGKVGRFKLGTSAAVIILRRFYLPNLVRPIFQRIRLRTRLREGWRRFVFSK